MLKIATGRQTSWLFTKSHLGYEDGATMKPEIQVISAGLEPLVSRLQVQCPYH